MLQVTIQATRNPPNASGTLRDLVWMVFGGKIVDMGAFCWKFDDVCFSSRFPSQTRLSSLGKAIY
jgi:hypothetical protein